MADRALVTGGAGFIGLHLVRRLLDEGVQVTVLDDFSRGADDPELHALAGDVQLVRHDLTTPLPADLDRCDAVYHLAGVVGVQRVTDRPVHTMRTNVLATVSLLDWCARTQPSVLFLSSTSEVGDGAATAGLAELPVPEDAPFVLGEPRSPRTSYALSKLVAEYLFLHAGPPGRVRVARFYNVYGPRMGNEHVVPQLIERALAGTDPFPLYGGQQTRAFCHVDDAVEAVLRLCALPEPDPLVVNIGNDREEVEILDLARRICALAGLRPEFAVRPVPGGPRRRLPDLTRLRGLTGYEPAVTLDAGLRATFDWYAAHRSAS
ncbi:NAD-dependent epimerase/dehydratase family protein [Micromonospora carbonacea]|uniref:NAD-dependent epimerase/dehydratase family protein n=1 Tax=Micromonospora carbonacea TaxID=47853 RepID=A0A1C4YJS0_9ACTN|nr:NAD-dependent epimerase/dehydratase family protein [Micromonospora carbonacea]MBB5829117.1 UDP-glucose 4-epimerase/UDP-glucuronate decarboxylase [Micromonospora carbonacea]QLD23396.1 NAD-dependent epimerase/dehydratase family protein [Micromonospora carbonacea]SCF20969.1 UDP-glucose 4-epimerase [Micromonospora carbonacea]